MTAPLDKLIADVEAAVQSLEDAERGSLPYCDDPEDGCAEVWDEKMAEFARAAVALLSWPTGKWDAEATANMVARLEQKPAPAAPPFEQKQAEPRTRREPKPVIVYTTTPHTADSFVERNYENPPTNP